MSISVHKHVDAAGEECFQLRVHDQDASDVSGLFSLSRSEAPRCLGEAGWQEAACDIRASRVQRDGADLVFEIPARYGYQIDEYAPVLVQFHDPDLQENVIWEPVAGAHDFVDEPPGTDTPDPGPFNRRLAWIVAGVLLLLLLAALGYYLVSGSASDQEEPPDQESPPTESEPPVPPVPPEELETDPPPDESDKDPTPEEPDNDTPGDESDNDTAPESDRFREFTSALDNGAFDQARTLGQALIEEGDGRVMAIFARAASSAEFREGLFAAPDDAQALRLYTRACEAGMSEPEGFDALHQHLQSRPDAEADDLLAYRVPGVLEACARP